MAFYYCLQQINTILLHNIIIKRKSWKFSRYLHLPDFIRVQAKVAHWRSGQSMSRPQKEPSETTMPLNWRVPSPLLGKHPIELQRRTDRSRLIAPPAVLLAWGGSKKPAPGGRRPTLLLFAQATRVFLYSVGPLPVSCNKPDFFCTSDHIRKYRVGLLYCYILTPSLLIRLA